MLSGLPPARRRFFLGIGALVAIAVVVVATFVVLNRPADVTPVAQDAQPPVLLVPGYGGSTKDLDVLADSLRAEGRTAEVVSLGDGNVGDLSRQADALDAAVRAELRTTGQASVDLVGYSAGGVVVRLWVRDHDGGSTARRVVTLGSPHHGTDVAGLASDLAPSACPTACRQLSPDSDLIRKLNSGDETPEGPAWISIWSSDDLTVVPPSSAILDGAQNTQVQTLCPGTVVSHGDLPSDPLVIALVELALDRLLVAPTSALCVSP